MEAPDERFGDFGEVFKAYHPLMHPMKMDNIGITAINKVNKAP
jgi:hypothetical protein